MPAHGQQAGRPCPAGAGTGPATAEQVTNWLSATRRDAAGLQGTCKLYAAALPAGISIRDGRVMPQDDRAWADLSAADDPAHVAWLEDASCGPHVKALVVRAVQASNRGISAARWRRELLAEHPGAAELLAEAEQCMRSSGLWPWPGQAGKPAS